MADQNCFPWWHGVYEPLMREAWAKTIVPSGCVADYTGSVPCSPEAMRASAEAWLTKNAPQVIPMIGGSLSQEVYTFARYMHSEVGSGTIEERVAVGEAAVNQAIRRAGLTGDFWSKLNKMLLPNGKYGAIHVYGSYCPSIGKTDGCNAANRWAATTRDPSVMAILLANLVVSRQSGDFANGAQTQWGPDALSWAKAGNFTTTNVINFVRSAASDSQGRYYWVGPLPGVDPWHTFLTKRGPAANTAEGQALIQTGIGALPVSGGRPVRTTWEGLSVCAGGPSLFAGAPLSRTEMVLLALAGLGGLAGAVYFDRWLGNAKSV
jgi:hypothetical protein